MLDTILIIVAIAVVIVVLLLQIKSFRETQKKIKELLAFFPSITSLKIIETTISKSVLQSPKSLEEFIKDPPARDTSEQAIDTEEYSDLSLIKLDTTNPAFQEVVNETNAYLCKNVGTAADLSLLQDICERKVEVLEESISNTVNVPLYLGLAGTFIGIITGLIGIAVNVQQLFDAGNMDPLRNLLLGVVIAMLASFVGLGLMVYNSAIEYKKAIGVANKNKNVYYDFLRRELMPVLSNSMSSSLNSLRGVLGHFVDKFGRNLDAYSDSAQLLNDNLEKQHLVLLEINKMDKTQLSVQLAQALEKIQSASSALSSFTDYHEKLKETIVTVNGGVSKIENVIESFNEFSKNLNIVASNQNTTNELQLKFQNAIETHFPTGAEGREMWRKEFDNLSKDAVEVSNEVNEQLKLSTEYIKNFVEENKTVFGSLSKMGEVLDSLVKYSEVQANCYKDLKTEISNLKQEQIETQSKSAQLSKDLLVAVREMSQAVKSLKN